MKKTAIITVLLTASSFAFAELHPASRYVDIGYDFNVSASQNVTGVTDLLVEELNVNFTELADSMDDDGLVFNTSAGPGFHIDVSPGENQRYGIFLNAESSMRFATGKGIFELLGHGNAAGNLTSTAAAQGEMFMQTGINVKFKYGRVGWTVKPVYFVPVFYIPRTEMNITVITNDKDYMAKAYGSTNVNIYSNFNLGSAFDSDFKFLGAGELFSAVGDDISSILSSGGIALNLEAEYQLLNTLCAGVYTEVPIIAGSLGYSARIEKNVSDYLKSRKA